MPTENGVCLCGTELQWGVSQQMPGKFCPSCGRSYLMPAPVPAVSAPVCSQCSLPEDSTIHRVGCGPATHRFVPAAPAPEAVIANSQSAPASDSVGPERSITAPAPEATSFELPPKRNPTRETFGHDAPEATREADDVTASVRLALRGLRSLTDHFARIVNGPRRGGVMITREMATAILIELQDKCEQAAERAALSRENETLTGALSGLSHVADRIDDLAQKPTFAAYRLHLDGLARTIRRAAALAARAPEPPEGRQP